MKRAEALRGGRVLAELAFVLRSIRLMRTTDDTGAADDPNATPMNETGR
jgi:hypothetical protein